MKLAEYKQVSTRMEQRIINGKVENVEVPVMDIVYRDMNDCEEAEQAAARIQAEQQAKLPTTEERLAALDKLPETLAALQSAQNDTDSLMVDQEYRLTLLELGITE